MYVNAFALGVGVTLFVEMTLITVALLWKEVRKIVYRNNYIKAKKAKEEKTNG